MKSGSGRIAPSGGRRCGALSGQYDATGRDAGLARERPGEREADCPLAGVGEHLALSPLERPEVITTATHVRNAAAALALLHALITAHVMAAERLHGDDTTVPLLARGKTATARLWVYVRDDRPFAGDAPPAALFRFTRDRRGEHPQAHLARWHRHPAGRRLRRLRGTLRRRPAACADHRGAVLGACATQVLRARRHRRERPPRQGRPADLAARARGGAAHRPFYCCQRGVAHSHRRPCRCRGFRGSSPCRAPQPAYCRAGSQGSRAKARSASPGWCRGRSFSAARPRGARCAARRAPARKLLRTLGLSFW